MTTDDHPFRFFERLFSWFELGGKSTAPGQSVLHADDLEIDELIERDGASASGATPDSEA